MLLNFNCVTAQLWLLIRYAYIDCKLCLSSCAVCPASCFPKTSLREVHGANYMLQASKLSRQADVSCRSRSSSGGHDISERDRAKNVVAEVSMRKTALAQHHQVSSHQTRHSTRRSSSHELQHRHSVTRSLGDKFAPRSDVVEPPLVAIAESLPGVKEGLGNSRPVRSRRPLSGKRREGIHTPSSSSRDSSTERVKPKPRESSRSKVKSRGSSSERVGPKPKSRESSSERRESRPTLQRSDSFTKARPSGVVPTSEIPDVGQEGPACPPRLLRSDSFTKDKPGISKDLIPKISSEFSDSSSASSDAERNDHRSLDVQQSQVSKTNYVMCFGFNSTTR